MEAAAGKGEVATAAPDPAAALLALSAADDSLHAARERLAGGDYPGSFADSKNAIRFASSSLLMREGFVGETAEGVAGFLARRFPGEFPTDAWLDLERIPDEDSPGLYNILLSAMGRLKKAGEQEAIHALHVAESFVRAAKSEMGL